MYTHGKVAVPSSSIWLVHTGTHETLHENDQYLEIDIYMR